MDQPSETLVEIGELLKRLDDPAVIEQIRSDPKLREAFEAFRSAWVDVLIDIKLCQKENEP